MSTLEQDRTPRRRDLTAEYEASQAFHDVLSKIQDRFPEAVELVGDASDRACEWTARVEERAHGDSLAGLGWLDGTFCFPDPEEGTAYTLGELAKQAGLAANVYLTSIEGVRVPLSVAEVTEGAVTFELPTGAARVDPISAVFRLESIKRALASLCADFGLE